MSDLDLISINSHKGVYQVHFLDRIFEKISEFNSRKFHIIIDQNVKDIYSKNFSCIQSKLESALILKANEEAKSIDKFSIYVENLIQNKVRRGDVLVAIGGGVIQDIACFLSSIYLRGIDWIYIPTTLLAQADSCIGSKSSINVGQTKNILGTFYPPKEIYISPKFLDSLNEDEMRSGIGEIIKIYGIYGPTMFEKYCKDLEVILSNKGLLLQHIHNSLNLKKKIIEQDEFDQSTRLVLNYGHSFGHAIESATNYSIPHGIAVSMGCHFANFISRELKINNGHVFEKMSPILKGNFGKFKKMNFDFSLFISSLLKDKKNQAEHLVLILPNYDGIPSKTKVEKNEDFINLCKQFISTELDFAI